MQTANPQPAHASYRPDAIARWLYAVAALVFLMVVVGGITRLTESGLSITEWKPVTGAIPPLSDAAWNDAFARYRQIPEFQILNPYMTLAEFQTIYLWEWGHRLLGRLIGLAYALPFLWFLFKKAIPNGYTGRLVLILALGGLQGAIGWWMVKSGLTVRTDVSQYRLATHLTTAFVILSFLLWTARDMRTVARTPDARPSRLTGFGVVVFAGLFLQLVMGAIVAGLKAGYASNTWPLMNGHFFPEDVTWHGFATLGEDPFLIHFLHRWWAWGVVALLIVLARKLKKMKARPQAIAIHSAFGTQIILGIALVMTSMNFWLAILHQAVGTLVLVTTVIGVHTLGKR